MTAFSSYWLLPLLFMFHDFEELVSVPTWLSNHNPKIYGRTLFGGVDRSDSLAAGVWEEFSIFMIIAALAYWLEWPLLVVAMTVPYLFHLVMHLWFVVVKRSYVPGVITATVEIPVMVAYLIANAETVQASWWLWLGALLLMFLVFAGNLAVIHWWMNWMTKIIR